MKQLLGKEYDAFLSTFSDTAKKALHLNTSMLSNQSFEQCCDFSITKIPHIANGYYYENPKIGSHPLHHAGAVYSQDPAAMLPVSGFFIHPDWKVLDLCAAPGGKTSQIAQALSKGKGILLSNEINASRNKILVSNIERMGYRNVLVTKLTPEEIADTYPSFFDCILVDAPCSGEGMFRKYPDSINEWSLENVSLCAKRQKDILNQAVTCLRSGGYLIYSTCTYAPEEDEEIISYLVENHHFHTLSAPQSIMMNTISEVPDCNRFYPHISQGEGQFMAYLQKDGELSDSSFYEPNLKKISSKNKELFLQTMGNVFDYSNIHLFEHQERILAIPEEFMPLPKHGITLCSCNVGIIEKGRFTPSHQLFHAYPSLFLNKTSLSIADARVHAYLCGNEIEIEPTQKGYGVLLYEGCPLGGYKAVTGRGKNHYPKALRNYL